MTAELQDQVPIARQDTPRCTCDGDPVECSHELARAMAEHNVDAVRAELVEARAEVKRVTRVAALLNNEVSPQ